MVSYEILEQSFDHLLQKAIKAPHRFIGEQGLNIKDIQFYKKDYVQHLYTQLQNNVYPLSVLKRITVVTDKERKVFQFPLPDLIIHNAVSLILKNKIEPLLSDNLFSYRKGKNSHQALNSVIQKISDYRKKYSGLLNQRGLYVIRKDISKYTDCISTTPDSILLRQIWSCFENENAGLSLSYKKLIEKILNPNYIDVSESNATKEIKTFHFLPTGSPLVTILSNLYLSDMDIELSKIENSLYLRFGDDILFISESKDKFILAERLLKKTCAAKGLIFNPEKSKNYFLNSAGRKLDTDTDLEIRGCHYFDYLGARIDFNAGLQLKTNKIKLFFMDFKKYLVNLSDNFYFEYGDKWKTDPNLVHHFIKDVNGLLCVKSAFYIRYLDFIMFNISDRKYFLNLDNQISRTVLKHLSSKSNPNPLFSPAPYKILHKQFGLQRLITQKNSLYDQISKS